MARKSTLRSLGLVALAVACGGSPEPPAKAPTRAAPAGTKVSPELPELDLMKVAYAMRRNDEKIRDCFAYDGEPVRGFMRVVFEVEGTGEVSNIEVENSSISEPGVAACLSVSVAGLYFDAPGKKMRTHWTFVSGLYEKPDEDARSAKREKKKKKRDDREAEQGVVLDPTSRGSLAPDEIEEVVHAGFGLFAHCYREGLERHPRLAGVVRLRMAVGNDGRVDVLSDAKSDIPDPELIDCVAEGFFALRFPKPRYGTAGFVYRLTFDRG
jgi:hypothetical protein